MTDSFDRAGKHTGSGKIAYKLTVDRDVVCKYLLYNFNIDGNELKPEHKAFLDGHLVPLLRNHEMHVRLTGTASKSAVVGDPEYNRQLSAGRLLRVKRYLAGRGIPESKLPGSEIIAAGEHLSTSASHEDELDRAVQITVAVGIKPLPIWPEIVIPMLIGSNEAPGVVTLPAVDIVGQPAEQRWSIRQISGYSLGYSVGPAWLGAGVGNVHVEFLLYNQQSNKMAQCAFNGVSSSAGPGPTVSGSATYASRSWATFSTPPSVTFQDFEGSATWRDPASLGLGTSVSVDAQLSVGPVAGPVHVTTGDTIGLPSSSASVGYFTCKRPVQQRN